MNPSRRGGRRATGPIALLAALAACGGGLTVALAGSPSGGGEVIAGPGAERPAEPGTGPRPSGPARGGDRGDGRERTPRTEESRGAARGEGPWPEVAWRDSTAVGFPTGGRLVDGVHLPDEGRHFFTWDPVKRISPNRPWRRWGTNHAVRTTLRVLAEHRRGFPRAPRLGVGDISRPHGGDFGTAYGPIGHVSHQNGLDVDVYYPLEDGRERAPRSVGEIDLVLSQDLVNRFVAAGAEKVFVGPATGLSGPAGMVQAIPNHDDHLHVRFPAG